MYPDFYPDDICKSSSKVTKHDPPLLYDLNHDPGELNPLTTTESPYKEILAEINQVSPIHSYVSVQPIGVCSCMLLTVMYCTV